MLLDRALSAAVTAVRRNGEDVLFSQAGQQVPLRALASKPAGLIDNMNVVQLEYDGLDWTIVADDLDQLEPLPGSTLTRHDGSTYEILPIAGQKCWHYVDARDLLICVHSKLIDRP